MNHLTSLFYLSLCTSHALASSVRELTAEEYENCDNGRSSKKCFTFDDDSCILTKNCSMLLSRDIHSIDKQVPLLKKNNQQGLVDPDIVVIRIVRNLLVKPLFQIGIPTMKGVISLNCTAAGEAVACGQCEVVATKIQDGCQFEFAVNKITKGITMNPGAQINIKSSEHEEEDTGIDVGDYTKYDYLSGDCKSKSVKRRVLCSKEGGHMTKAIMAEQTLRIYTHSIDESDVSTLVTMEGEKMDGMVFMCFPGNDDYPAVLNVGKDTEIMVLNNVTTDNVLYYHRLADNVHRTVFELDLDSLKQQTKMDFRVDNYTIETWTSPANTCRTDMDENDLKQFRANVLAGTVKGSGKIEAKFEFKDGVKDDGRNTKTTADSHVMKYLIYLAILIAVLVVAAIFISKKSSRVHSRPSAEIVGDELGNPTTASSVNLLFRNQSQSTVKREP
ncbi:hypothetical protein HDE_00788 [Halotydeus destructor]|nr:hypothetical protein HDE_00788 [Halotydeus destructor]